MTLVAPTVRSFPPVPLCELERLHPERGVAALVHGHQVALFKLTTGEVFAIDNYDPTTGVNVLARGMIGTADGQWYVASPLYKTRFSLESGDCLSDPAYRVAVHTVTVENGVIAVTLQPQS